MRTRNANQTRGDTRDNQKQLVRLGCPSPRRLFMLFLHFFKLGLVRLEHLQRFILSFLPLPWPAAWLVTPTHERLQQIPLPWTACWLEPGSASGVRDLTTATHVACSINVSNNKPTA